MKAARNGRRLCSPVIARLISHGLSFVQEYRIVHEPHIWISQSIYTYVMIYFRLSEGDVPYSQSFTTSKPPNGSDDTQFLRCSTAFSTQRPDDDV